jgi:hypothetical protein
MKLVEHKESTSQIFSVLHSRIQQIKQNYTEFIQQNQHNLFVFTLDSFYFQGKLIDIEYEDMQRLYFAITNKMYCEYYKLHKIIVSYVEENVTDQKLLDMVRVPTTYPVYKDLEPFKQYDFQWIKELHEAILVLLTSMNSHILNKEHDLKIYQTKNQIGFSIDNFVNTFNFNINMMREKIMLFISYIEFFHKTHSKYFTRFMTKIQLMLSQLNHDIKFESVDTKKSSKKIISQLKNDQIDKHIVNELKRAMMDDVASSTGSDMTIVEPARKPLKMVILTDEYPATPAPSLASVNSSSISMSTAADSDITTSRKDTLSSDEDFPDPPAIELIPVPSFFSSDGSTPTNFDGVIEDVQEVTIDVVEVADTPLDVQEVVADAVVEDLHTEDVHAEPEPESQTEYIVGQPEENTNLLDPVSEPIESINEPVENTASDPIELAE